MKLRVVAAALLLLPLAACGTPVATPPTAAPTPPTDVTSPPAQESGNLDQPPNHADNRAAVLPKHLSDEARARLEAEASKLRPHLETLHATGRVTPDTVQRSLIDYGYPADAVGTYEKYGTPTVVFGVRQPDGCVAGAIFTDHVQVAAMGPSQEWGCVPPDTH